MADKKNNKTIEVVDELEDLENYVFILEQENEDLKDENNALQSEIEELKARD